MQNIKNNIVLSTLFFEFIIKNILRGASLHTVYITLNPALSQPCFLMLFLLSSLNKAVLFSIFQDISCLLI